MGLEPALDGLAAISFLLVMVPHAVITVSLALSLYALILIGALAVAFFAALR